jgi:hypothetical protein
MNKIAIQGFRARAYVIKTIGNRALNLMIVLTYADSKFI